MGGIAGSQIEEKINIFKNSKLYTGYSLNICARLVMVRSEVGIR